MNSATTDDEDFSRKHRPQGDDQEGSGDDEFYDSTYFGEYEDDDDGDGESDGDGHSSDESDSASSPGDVDMTEPPPFIIEEEIASWNNKFGSSSSDKKTSPSDKHGNNDIDFEDNADATKDRKPSNVHNPNDRNNNNNNHSGGSSSNKRIINAAAKLSSGSKISTLLISNLAFIVAAKLLVVA